MQEELNNVGSSLVSDQKSDDDSIFEQESFLVSKEPLDEDHNINISVDHEPSWIVYPLENYGIRVQDNANEALSGIQISEMNGFNKKVDSFLKDGIGRSVAALMLTHRYLCPHVVLLQNDLTSEWMLPNCTYKAWENPRLALANFLKSMFLLSSSSMGGNSSSYSGHSSSLSGGGNIGSNVCSDNAVEVGEYLGTWWRTEFNYSPLPYLPPHSTRPKETIRIYQVILPPKLLFKLPKHHVLKSLPLFELDPNIFGIACGSIPQLISRFQIQSMVQSEN
ncbi:NUDIX domain-protein and mRNA cleavage factor-like protein Im like [Cryptosporidium canis]|uniref:Cleavage and polyadenylation specificity factor subunit 5 n=1 Tax=Cryptosporidium canis TaxID=195482 RepID=A0ABQ8P4X7_9CRYT|nr:NUDIX domain-protein and mRNA cleavage factor-like protein Im like [Cryptosporidium canis]KAJ1608746.1 NUDIX domain-protein and mRNA cleavage factor-like protein Im like [Cryptosporidium canis]